MLDGHAVALYGAEVAKVLWRGKYRGGKDAVVQKRRMCCGAGAARVGQGAGARIPMCVIARARERGFRYARCGAREVMVRRLAISGGAEISPHRQKEP